MESSLSIQMLDVYEKSRARAQGFLKRYQGRPAFSDPDSFEFSVRNRFFMGVHTAFSEEILASLGRDLGTQQQIADALGLKDRTSISKMHSSGTMEGVRLTAALYQFEIPITPRIRQLATLQGFAHATSYIKAQIDEDNSIEGTMTAQEFSYLVGMLASDEWDEALTHPDPTVARNVAITIVDERNIDAAPPVVSSSHRSEQYVLMFRELYEMWAESGLIALCVIPQCIPTEDLGAEVTL